MAPTPALGSAGLRSTIVGDNVKDAGTQTWPRPSAPRHQRNQIAADQSTNASPSTHLGHAAAADASLDDICVPGCRHPRTHIHTRCYLGGKRAVPSWNFHVVRVKTAGEVIACAGGRREPDSLNHLAVVSACVSQVFADSQQEAALDWRCCTAVAVTRVRHALPATSGSNAIVCPSRTLLCFAEMFRPHRDSRPQVLG